MQEITHGFLRKWASLRKLKFPPLVPPKNSLRIFYKIFHRFLQKFSKVFGKILIIPSIIPHEIPASIWKFDQRWQFQENLLWISSKINSWIHSVINKLLWEFGLRILLKKVAFKNSWGGHFFQKNFQKYFKKVVQSFLQIFPHELLQKHSPIGFLKNFFW